MPETLTPPPFTVIAEEPLKCVLVPVTVIGTEAPCLPLLTLNPKIEAGAGTCQVPTGMSEVHVFPVAPSQTEAVTR